MSEVFCNANSILQLFKATDPHSPVAISYKKYYNERLPVLQHYSPCVDPHVEELMMKNWRGHTKRTRNCRLFVKQTRDRTIMRLDPQIKPFTFSVGVSTAHETINWDVLGPLASSQRGCEASTQWKCDLRVVVPQKLIPNTIERRLGPKCPEFEQNPPSGFAGMANR